MSGTAEETESAAEFTQQQYSVEIPKFNMFFECEPHEELRGTGYLRGPLTVLDNDNAHALYVVYVTLIVSAESSLANLSVYTESNQPGCTIAFYVSSKQFNSIRSASKETFFSLSVWFPNLIRLKNGRAETTAKLNSFVQRPHFSTYRPIKLHRNLLTNWVTKLHRQIGEIADELLVSLEDWLATRACLFPEFETHIQSLGEILSDLRGSYVGDVEITQLLIQSPKEFAQGLAFLPELKQAEAIRLYDTIWKHPNVSAIATSGTLHDNNYPELPVDRLEAIARTYIRNPWMHSSTLEWVLIDAMLFGECIAFARSLNGLPINKSLAAIRQGLGRLMIFAFAEGFALALTGLVAQAVDSSREIGFWMTFATITVIRWLRPNRRLEQKQKSQSLKLFAEMAQAHDRLKRYDFNPHQLREILYELEKRGAVFSPYVFHILDRRIARTSASFSSV